MNGLALGTIHPTAIISEQARLGSGVSIGANCIVYDNVEIGDGKDGGLIERRNKRHTGIGHDGTPGERRRQPG